MNGNEPVIVIISSVSYHAQSSFNCHSILWSLTPVRNWPNSQNYGNSAGSTYTTSTTSHHHKKHPKNNYAEQGMYRVCAGYVQGMYRVCAG